MTNFEQELNDATMIVEGMIHEELRKRIPKGMYHLETKTSHFVGQTILRLTSYIYFDGRWQCVGNSMTISHRYLEEVQASAVIHFTQTFLGFIQRSAREAA